jgi:O-antigen ligase
LVSTVLNAFMAPQAANSPALAPRGDLADVWAEDAFEASLFYGLLAGLAWAPFWLGGNRPLAWGVNGVWFPSLTILFELSLLARGRRHAISIRRLMVPVSLFAGVVIWIGVQMSTWAPPAVVHPIWSMAGVALGSPLAGAISVDPDASALALLRLLTDASVLWLTIQLCRSSKRALVLIRAVAGFVAIYSAYGLFLAGAFAGAIPFFELPDSPGFVRSTFVNRDHFATYAGLGLVATVALLMRFYRHEMIDRVGPVAFRVSRFIEATARGGVILIGGGLVIMVALLATVSRGGILASALGVFSILAMSLTIRRDKASQQIEAVLFVTIALAAGLLLFGDRIVGRIAATGFEDTSRMAVYAIATRSIMDSPFLGFGYGTFADVFPMYRDQSVPILGVWDHAHNTYLEVLQGLGLLFGTALMAALGILVFRCLLGTIRRRRNITAAVAGGAGALLVGVHAMVDFSLQIEGVTLTFMALLGAGVAQAESSRHAVSD